ncbi:MAG: hypothetical protein P1U68_14375 [Verrucomicrobiales bacterium]|nr:hypothetical protein [Verrucomicrobiales bacterium]
MKTSLAIFLMICLQVAMSPLCLCFGAEATEEEPAKSCCHAPVDVDTAPCPHCDQELPISATAPVKGDFDAEPPEWHGSALFFGVSLLEGGGVEQPAIPAQRVPDEIDPPPFLYQEVFGVYLI